MDLDDAYANGPYIPDAQTYPPKWETDAAAYRDRLSSDGLAQLDIPYGPGSRNRFDLFLPKGATKGLFVFVHGGYWLRFDKSSWSHFAEGARAQGWAVALPSYDLCPSARISEITGQIAAAISNAADHIAGPVHLAGHSAGGHLVARMAASGVLPKPVAQRVANIVPISPLCDLRPLMSTEMNTGLRIDDAEAQSESPLFQPKPDIPIHVWVGANERPVFLDQAAWLSHAWACPMTAAPDRHHFDVIDALKEIDSDLTRTVLACPE